MRPRAPCLGTGKVMNYHRRSRFRARSHRLRAAAIGLGETLGPIAEKIDLPPPRARAGALPSRREVRSCRRGECEQASARVRRARGQPAGSAGSRAARARHTRDRHAGARSHLSRGRARRQIPAARPWPRSRQPRRNKGRDRMGGRRARRPAQDRRCARWRAALPMPCPRTTGTSARTGPSARRQPRSRRRSSAKP